ncbi:hypothetical protein H1D32_08530 [Anaerobacillus sp. CMMVII]|uniref:hypothetical protein n=1 Tax=Anaerobacillus sp. CMMVII TaxID=2755588 RepID=UPI0021B78549|nr:hypothetical protein [Anaerobacillus sp. CMMVII]MCT8137797.1 hypothetical protein [Anaerobacillus sp. CMMVII]
MNSIIMDIAIMLYLFFIVLAFIGSYYYGSYMISKSGYFLLHSIIAVIMSLALGIFALISWIMFSWGTNEHLLFGGLSLGAGFVVVGVLLLVSILCVKRKDLLSIKQVE